MKRILVFILVLFLAPTIFAQRTDIIPPSPNAASLGQYGEYPVGNYTGLPAINIPLYTVRSGKIEMPVTLSYHASGVKVAQEASWVGLGWSLNAGGVIARQINGLDDFKNTTGNIGSPSIPDAASLNWWSYSNITESIENSGSPEVFSKCMQYASGSLDGQPDVFYYNFLGLQGRIFFEKQSGSDYEGTPVEQNNLRFVFKRSTGTFEVTDANGWKYYFQTTEISRSQGESGSVTPINEPNGSQTEDMVSAWYLDKVVTSEGDEVSFTYKRTGRWVRSQPYYDETMAISDGTLMVNNEPGFVHSVVNNYAYSASFTMVDEVYLDRIDFATGYLKFNTSTRKDRLTWLSAANAPLLSSISVFNKADILTRKYVFDTSYFREDKLNATDSKNFLRLRLNSVTEQHRKDDGSFASIPPYRFRYNEIPFPAKNSFSIDHFGYFNGADNDNIIEYKFIDLSTPATQIVHKFVMPVRRMLPSRFIHINDNERIFILGANREPDRTNMQAATLIGIQYPTAGYTEIKYEPNDFYMQNETHYDETQVTPVVVNCLGVKQKTFMLNQETFVFLRFDLVNNNYQGDPNNTTIMNNMTAVLQRSDGTDIVKFIPSDDQMDNQPGGNNNVDAMSSYICVALPAGTYNIKADHGGYVYLSMTLEARYGIRAPSNKKIGAGLRVSTITNYEIEGGSFLNSKKYIYEEGGYSLGKLLHKSQPFLNVSDLIFNRTSMYQPCCYIQSVVTPQYNAVGVGHHFMTTGSNIVPFGVSQQGNVIAYSKVIVKALNELGESLGHTVYYYKNSPEYYPGTFIPNVPGRRILDNGQLEVEEVVNANGFTVKKKIFNHKQVAASDKKVSGVSVAFRPPLGMSFRKNEWTYSSDIIPYFASYYELWSQWWYVDKITEMTFDVSGTNPVTKVTDFEYANPSHKLLTKATEKDSNGNVREEFQYYSADNPSLPGTVPSTLSRMITDNILSPVVKHEVKVNDQTIKATINNYEIDSYDHVVPSIVSFLNTSSMQYENDFEFEKHDDRGRVLQEKGKNGVTVSYIWSYYSEFPVVKAENVNYVTLRAAVEAIAGTTDLEFFWSSLGTVSYNNAQWKTFNDNLRSYSTLLQSFITTYAYTPLTGMCAWSDPNGNSTYYEYDDLRRLKFIRNNKGEIIKSFEYKYSQD